MTQTLESIDLDVPDVAPPPPPWRARAPWIVAALAIVLAVVTLTIRLPRPVATPLPPPATGQTLTPKIETKTSDGIGSGASVWRNQDGLVIGVMDSVRPYGEETVWCELTVDGTVIRDEQSGGAPAVCVWIRGAS